MIRATLGALAAGILLVGCGQSKPVDAASTGPRTVDDLFTVIQNSADNRLDVLANDSGDALTLAAAPDTTEAGGTLTLRADDGLAYPPPAD